MPKYLIIITGNTLSGEPVSVTVHADDIIVNDVSFNFYVKAGKVFNVQTGEWIAIKYEEYFNINILWQSDGFCGHLAYVKVSKGEKK